MNSDLHALAGNTIPLLNIGNPLICLRLCGHVKECGKVGYRSSMLYRVVYEGAFVAAAEPQNMTSTVPTVRAHVKRKDV